MRKKRYSQRELNIGGQALRHLVSAYLHGDVTAKRHVEPLVRRYLDQRDEPRPLAVDLANAAWQIWLREGKSIARMLEGVEKVRREHGLERLTTTDDDRDDLIKGIERYTSPTVRENAKGRPTAESTSVASIYRLLSGRRPDERAGVRKEDLQVVEAGRANAWLIVRGQVPTDPGKMPPMADIPSGELVTRKTKTKRH